ncbi:MAG: helix-hairpin-helix domain-containing protein [Clostridia bacterium]
MWQNLPKNMKIMVVIIGISFVCGIGILLGKYAGLPAQENTLVISQEEQLQKDESNPIDTQKLTVPTKIMVHVTGAVENPGLYELNSDSRVQDAVILAKPTIEADVNLLNLAAFLDDGQKLIVPKIGDTEVASLNNSLEQSENKININQANVQELVSLNGIGEVIAARIIEYRDNNGIFAKPEDLLNVSGIGPKKLEGFIAQIRVR